MEEQSIVNKNWVYFDPADQSTAAMLEFILVSCYVIRSIAERFRFPVSEEDKAGIVSTYLKRHPEAESIPRYTLLAAVNWPSRKVDGFILPPREGWSSTETKINDSPTWEQYNRGETAHTKTDTRTVDAEVAYDQFLSDKKLHFKWGTLVMHTGYIFRLKKQAGDFNGTFLSNIKYMEVRIVKTRNGERKWKIHFQL